MATFDPKQTFTERCRSVKNLPRGSRSLAHICDTLVHHFRSVLLDLGPLGVGYAKSLAVFPC